MNTEPRIIEFECAGKHYRIREAPNALEIDGEFRELNKRGCELFWFFAERPGDEIDFETLRQGVWGDTHVGRDSASKYVSLVRKALGPSGKKIIETLGVKYRFNGKLNGKSIAAPSPLIATATPESVKAPESPASRNGMPPPGPLRMKLYPANFEPSLGAKFVGRDADLVRVHEALGGGAAALSGALVNSGGFGKTRLAREYVWRYGMAHYPGGIVWIDASETVAPLETQHHGILKLFCEDTPTLEVCRERGIDIHDRLSRYFQEGGSGKAVLAVVDNVPEPEEGQPVRDVAHYCPGASHLTVLATSRLDLEGLKKVAVEELELAHAVELLTADLPGKDALTREQWGRIAEWVGRLPLVLELLNAGMRAKTQTAREVYALAASDAPMTAELDGVRDALKTSVGPHALRGVTMAFADSYARLRPEVQRAARVAAHWAPAAVPMELAKKGLGAERTALLKQSWMKPAADDNVPQFGAMHRVIADFLRTKAEANDAQTAVQAVRAAWPDDTVDPANWPAAERLWVHGQASVGYAETHGVAAEDCVWVLNELGSLAYYRGTLNLSRQQFERANKIAQEKLGAEHPKTLTSMNNLAETMWAQGDLDRARKILEEVLAIFQRVSGAEHPNTLTLMSNLASTMRTQGELDRARKMQEEVLTISRRVLGAEHPNTLTSMNNLAATMKVQGDLDAARMMLEGVLDICRRVLGAEHPKTLTSMNNLALTMRDQGNLAEARQMQEEVLAIQRRVLGAEHPSTLISMNNLALTMRAQGDLAGARQMQEEVLAIRRRVLGAGHPDTLTSMSNLAATMRAQGDLAGARQMQEEVLAIRRRVLGSEHPNTSVSAWNLASTLVQLEENAEAERVARENLFWLMDAPEGKLSADQRKARDWAKRTFGW